MDKAEYKTSRDLLESINQALIGQICHDIMNDEVTQMCSSCGVTWCNAGIVRWKLNSMKCPNCRCKLSVEGKKNICVSNVLSQIKTTIPKMLEIICEEHNKICDIICHDGSKPVGGHGMLEENHLNHKLGKLASEYDLRVIRKTEIEAKLMELITSSTEDEQILVEAQK